MRRLKSILFLGVLSIVSIATSAQAEPARYQATAVEGTIVEFAKDRESVMIRLSNDKLMTYKIQRYTSRSHKPTTFSDSRGLKIDYSTLEAVGYIHKVRLSLSGNVVTHLAVVRLQPE